MGGQVDSGNRLSTGDLMHPQRLKFKHRLLISHLQNNWSWGEFIARIIQHKFWMKTDKMLKVSFSSGIFFLMKKVLSSAGFGEHFQKCSSSRIYGYFRRHCFRKSRVIPEGTLLRADLKGYWTKWGFGDLFSRICNFN